MSAFKCDRCGIRLCDECRERVAKAARVCPSRLDTVSDEGLADAIDVACEQVSAAERERDRLTEEQQRRLGAKRRLAESWRGPKSVCSCGHDGDGTDTDHAKSGLAPGHGMCLVPGCPCRKFRWKKHTSTYLAALRRESEAEARRTK